MHSFCPGNFAYCIFNDDEIQKVKLIEPNGQVPVDNAWHLVDSWVIESEEGRRGIISTNAMYALKVIAAGELRRRLKERCKEFEVKLVMWKAKINECSKIIDNACLY